MTTMNIATARHISAFALKAAAVINATRTHGPDSLEATTAGIQFHIARVGLNMDSHMSGEQWEMANTVWQSLLVAIDSVREEARAVAV